ncbi:HAMP domain-containing sensor histidine kinase [Methylocystis sp. 9N]|uniref:histidine kinase n=1 Tax=Methylocystis borbori TaxID=3118750 RepID=A0ABU7XIW6_9HYPH
MRALQSLSSRLVVYWVFFSMLAFFTIPATVLLPLASLGIDDVGYVRLEGHTVKRARTLLAHALRRTPDGAAYIEMTDDLRNYKARNPGFRYAAFDATSGAVLEGSSRELVDDFNGALSRLEILGATFHIPGDPNVDSRGSVRMVRTPAGRFGTIVYGAQFHWDDLLFWLYYYPTTANIIAYIPLCATLSLVAFVVVRKNLKPLRASAATIAEIDLDSLDRRVSTAGLPSEIVPFVDAVNAALARVNEGVARQRRFIANSAHELRTPVAILRTRLEKLDEALIKQELKRDAQRIQTILEQLLVLAQVEERGTAAPMPELDLGETALAVTADYTPIALSNGRRISFEPPPHPVVAKGYKWAVESVVTNLLENAVRAEPAGGMVVIRVTADGVVEVEDHGEGVEEAHRQTIFEPFWRKSDATPGTGLGLAIAKELMEKLHGRIWIEETPRGGATFKLAFATAEPG